MAAPSNIDIQEPFILVETDDGTSSGIELVDTRMGTVLQVYVGCPYSEGDIVGFDRSFTKQIVVDGDTFLIINIENVYFIATALP